MGAHRNVKLVEKKFDDCIGIGNNKPAVEKVPRKSTVAKKYSSASKKTPLESHSLDFAIERQIG